MAFATVGLALHLPFTLGLTARQCPTPTFILTAACLSLTSLSPLLLCMACNAYRLPSAYSDRFLPGFICLSSTVTSCIPLLDPAPVPGRHLPSLMRRSSACCAQTKAGAGVAASWQAIPEPD